jgi:hypothetical protein
MKIRFLFEGNFDVEGKAQHFEKGQEIDASEFDAGILVAGRCAEYVREENLVNEEIPRGRKVKNGNR